MARFCQRYVAVPRCTRWRISLGWRQPATYRSGSAGVLVMVVAPTPDLPCGHATAFITGVKAPSRGRARTRPPLGFAQGVCAEWCSPLMPSRGSCVGAKWDAGQVTSFYMGPGRPALLVSTWGDLVAAAQAGVLTETQWVELKLALPATSREANLELARDLASLSVDGGVAMIGVRNPGRSAEDVQGNTDDLESLRSRVSQIATARVRPPLDVTLTTLQHPDGDGRHVLVVTVPASASAPHMVDHRYWGRSATGKRPLTDAEASRLWAQRRGARDDFEQRLRAVPGDVDQLWPQPGQLGLAHLLLEPPLDNLAGRRSSGMHTLDVMNVASFRPSSAPGLKDLTRTLPHPDGHAFASFNQQDDVPEQQRLHLLVRDSGTLRLLGPATRQPRLRSGELRPRYISVTYLMELTHQALELAVRFGRDHLSVSGTWTLGLHLDGLAGLHSAQAMSGTMAPPQPFPTAEYTRTTTASAHQLQDQPAAVVEALLGDLARGLGLKGLFPYSQPDQIQQRAVAC